MVWVDGDEARPNLGQIPVVDATGSFLEANVPHELNDSLIVKIAACQKLPVSRAVFVWVHENVLLIPDGWGIVAESPAGVVAMFVLPSAVSLGEAGDEPLPKSMLL